ncbi:MAG: L-threonylcarbamoyladenylate synthase [Smithellaceae bacterium]|nr:L-threonylcarbamoyladenylate synthase [Smithellaceae bacterium]
MPKIIRIDPQNPDSRHIAEVVGALRDGEVIAYPTETFYGLGADGTNHAAIEKVYRIKGRDLKNPLPLIIGAEEDLASQVQEIPAPLHELIKEFWPGPLTLIFRASPSVSPLLTGNTGKVGIRVSNNPIATLLAKELGRPITATSANLAGKSECTTAEEVVAQLGDAIQTVIDGGKTKGGLGSTIIDATVSPARVLREGAIPSTLLRTILAL